MPLVSVGSYLPTIDVFSAHWVSAESKLGKPIVLRGGMTRAGLTALRGDLEGAIDAVTDAFADYTVMVGQKDVARAEMVPLVAAFNRAVRGALTGTGYEHNLPDAVGPLTGQAELIKALSDVASRWGQIDNATIAGFTGPLTLAGGLTLGQFTAKVATLEAAYLALENAEVALSVVRKERDSQRALVKTALTSYRRRIVGLFAPEDAIVLSLPQVNPEPGSTPPAVSVSGVWDGASETARLTIIPLSDPKVRVAHYEVRFCPGASYKTATEETIGRFGEGATTFETTVGLASSGASALFRVYTITETGNEKGSSTVKITR
ncbi:hypothetical protein [Armatimonas sp.]|uniref:hypothetical protein n=1 Tax=Armatimonas sp. TaxID=1872638 RepID=UPI00286BFB19|nr:hypothetical protein [Armatimonas sp.]